MRGCLLARHPVSVGVMGDGVVILLPAPGTKKALTAFRLSGLSLQPRSGRRDLNPRPPEPHSGALPGCATSRCAGKPRNLPAVHTRVKPVRDPAVRALYMLRPHAAHPHTRRGPCLHPGVCGLLRSGSLSLHMTHESLRFGSTHPTLTREEFGLCARSPFSIGPARPVQFSTRFVAQQPACRRRFFRGGESSVAPWAVRGARRPDSVRVSDRWP